MAHKCRFLPHAHLENKSYQIIEHTADLGIRVYAKDLKELFRKAALAMFGIITEESKFPAGRVRKITLETKADTLDELFINWLNELLSLSSVRGLIFFDFHIENLDEKSLRAIVSGRGASAYKVNTEIKAATYHMLKLKRGKSGWQAEVIFDV